jgi:hypothetical protein
MKHNVQLNIALEETTIWIYNKDRNRLAVNQNYILDNNFCCPKRETYMCLL